MTVDCEIWQEHSDAAVDYAVALAVVGVGVSHCVFFVGYLLFDIIMNWTKSEPRDEMLRSVVAPIIEVATMPHYGFSSVHVLAAPLLI